MAEEEKIEAGDTVRLKSGEGPIMTVEFLNDNPGDPEAYCVWFDLNKLVREKISLVALRKY